MNHSKKPIRKRVLILAFMIILFLLTVIVISESTFSLRPHDLQGTKLYIHNETCSSPESVRTVEDEALYQELISICTSDENYCNPYDEPLTFGDHTTLTFVQEDADIYYEIIVPPVLEVAGADQQTTVKKNEPVVVISIYDQNNEPTGGLLFDVPVVYLPQQNYDRLCDLILNYSGGEETTWPDIKKDM